MIVENPVRTADHSLAIPLRVPCQSYARLKIILVGLDALLQSQLVVCRLGKGVRFTQLRREFDVVTHTVVECELGSRSPGILPVDAEWLIGKRVRWAANTLDKVLRNAG